MVSSNFAGKTKTDLKAGTRLKKARLSCQLTLDEVALALRIPPLHLKSLEEGDLSVFCAAVYAKGAYVKYASYLGINSKDSLHAFLRSLSCVRRRVPLKLPVPSTWLHRFLTPSGVLMMVIALSVLLVAGYITQQIESFVRLPALALAEPTGSILSGAEVLVKGLTEAETEVTVNGENVLLNGANEFDFVLPLRSGINVLQVEAKGTSGRTRVITRHLLVPKN